MLHFTFDDGPNKSTPELLDLLDEYDVPATFFLVGEQVRRCPQYTAEIVRRGHAVGNHSMTHFDAWKADRAAIETEFDDAAACLEDVIGRRVDLMRPPYGRLNKAVVRWVRQRGQRLVMWDLMPPDFETAVPMDTLSRCLVRGVRRGSIIVLHENELSRGRTLPALRTALPLLREVGWEFLPLPSRPEDDAGSEPDNRRDAEAA